MLTFTLENCVLCFSMSGRHCFRRSSQKVINLCACAFSDFVQTGECCDFRESSRTRRTLMPQCRSSPRSIRALVPRHPRPRDGRLSEEQFYSCKWRPRRKHLLIADASPGTQQDCDGIRDCQVVITVRHKQSNRTRARAFRLPNSGDPAADPLQ
jgi:hypothetical protein